MRIVLQLACGLLMYGAPLSARGARIRPIATPAPASLVELLQPVHELGVRLAPTGLVLCPPTEVTLAGRLGVCVALVFVFFTV